MGIVTSIIDRYLHYNYTKLGLIETVTGLPTLLAVTPKLEKTIALQRVGMFYVDIENFRHVEAVYGREHCLQILRNLGQVLTQGKFDFYGLRQRIAVCCLGVDDFLVFTDVPGNDTGFETEYLKLKEMLENQLRELAHPAVRQGQWLNLHLGYVELERHRGSRFSSMIYKAVKEATGAAKTYSGTQKQEQWQLLQQIIKEQRITILYQPIVSIKSGQIFGYEALTRGPADSYYHNPNELFTAAANFDCLPQLENICLASAVKNAASILKNEYLFLNINPNMLVPGGGTDAYLNEMLIKAGVDKTRVVLELNERTQIRDYTAFRQTLADYRRSGFVFAIDDAGSGYSSLQAIAELQPEFIKVDMSLIRGVNYNVNKRAILETFIGFCNRIGARIICEGIETEEELEVIVKLRCNFGQGYLFSPPAGLPGQIAPSGLRPITQNSGGVIAQTLGGIDHVVGDLISYHQAIEPDLLVHDVSTHFKENRTIQGAVICDNDIPVGLIMRDRLFAMLGTQYGYSLFSKKRIADIMDKYPLVLDWYTSLEEVARRVADRINQGITDYIIVCLEGKFQGVVSVASLLDAMARIQVEQAIDCNPLTGLPGNRIITNRIGQALNRGEPVSVIYIDLDNFKGFNDYYGFEHGDRALLLTAEILKESTRYFGINSLVGHIGGDDFIIIASPGQEEAIAQYLIRRFDESIIDLYDEASRDRGFILSRGRDGVVREIPIMTISLAIVPCLPGLFENHFRVGEAAAEVKRKAKAIPASVYVTYHYDYEA